MQDQRDNPEAARRSDSVADATPGNWVDQNAPRALAAFLRLSRLDRPVGSWLLLLPCLWGLLLAMAGPAPTTALWPESGGLRAIWIALGCGVGAVLMRGAGCTWNDWTDRDIDAAVARTRSRPLPSGQVSPRAALMWLALQLGLSALILLSLHPLAIALGILALGPVAVYPFAKRFTWWPQVFLGIAFNWGALLAFAAWSGALAPAAFLAYFAGLFWTLFYDTIYAHQDREDDALIGVKSTARLFGAATKPWLAGFGIASVLMLALAVMLQMTGLARLIGLAGVGCFALHLAWQWRSLDIEDGAGLLRLFRSNRDAGLVVVPFLAIAALI